MAHYFIFFKFPENIKEWSHFQLSQTSILFAPFATWLIDSLCCRADDARQPLSRVVPIPSSHLTPYRVVIILRLIILGFFLQYRTTHPVKDAYPLWLTSVICEIWFALSWLLDQFPKWYPINRETFLERLALRSVYFVLFVNILLKGVFWICCLNLWVISCCYGTVTVL